MGWGGQGLIWFELPMDCFQYNMIHKVFLPYFTNGETKTRKCEVTVPKASNN